MGQGPAGWSIQTPHRESHSLPNLSRCSTWSALRPNCQNLIKHHVEDQRAALRLPVVGLTS